MVIRVESGRLVQCLGRLKLCTFQFLNHLETMAVALIGERVAIWIDPVEEVGKEYDHHTLARARYLSRKKPLPHQARLGGINNLFSAIGDLSSQLLARNPKKSADQDTGTASI
jgi:hypothetical protein